MNRIVLFIRGYCVVQIDGAEPQRCINAFLKDSIAHWDLERTDAYSWRCKIERKLLDDAQQAALHALCDLKVLEEHSLRKLCYGLMHRPMLLTMMVMLAVWIVMFPNFIWLMEVEGNADVPEEQILQELELMGIGFGTGCADLPHPRLLKYEMQLRIPELQWVAVNCHGGRATVLVAEREPEQETVSKREVCNLVAARDGVILEMNVLNGFAVCQPGQAVRKGELLVSGFMDHVLTTQATRAYGEVFALTQHEICAVTPAVRQTKQLTGRSEHCVYLNIGRNRIKIFGNSGISVSCCDKIVCEKLLTLPDGETLPLGLTIETYRSYTEESVTQSESAAMQVLTQGAINTLAAELVAGEVQTMEQELERTDAYYMLTTKAWCKEMIARADPVNFQITKEDEDGTNY